MCDEKIGSKKNLLSKFLFCYLLEVVTALCIVRKNFRVWGRYSVASYDIINSNSPKIQGID